MAEITWALLTKVYDRLEAEMMKSALESLDIPVELAQEGAGHWAIPLNFGDFAEVQVFVPKENLDEANEWLEDYNNDEMEIEEGEA